MALNRGQAVDQVVKRSQRTQAAHADDHHLELKPREAGVYDTLSRSNGESEQAFKILCALLCSHLAERLTLLISEIRQ